MTRTITMSALSAVLVLSAGFLFIPTTFATSAINHGDVVVNEFSSAGTEWVELYNTTGGVIDASALTLTDLTSPDTASSTEKTLPALSGTIAAGGFLTFDVSGLNDTGDSIGLFTSGTSTQLDRVTYGTVFDTSAYPVTGGLETAPTLGESAARTTDGGSVWAVTSTATKDGSNFLAIKNTTTSTDYTSLQTAIDGANPGDVITLSGTIGTPSNYTAYDIDTPIRIQGEAGTKVYGSFVIKSDGVTIDGLTMYTRGGGNGPLKAAIDVIAKTVTITNNTFELPNPDALATSGGVGNGVTIWPTGDADPNYAISGNTFNGFSADTPNWSSSALQMVEGLDLTRFGMGGTVTDEVALSAGVEKAMALANTYNNCSNDYVHSNWSNGIVYKFVLASNEDQLSGVEYTADGSTIVLGGDINVTSQLDVDKAITIDGNGHTITATANFGTDNSTKHLIDVISPVENGAVTFQNLTLDSNSKAYGLQFYGAQGSLDGVTIEHSLGAGLTVSGSTVSATDLNASGNAWGSVNVDPGQNVSDPSLFTFTSGTLSDDIQIWSDGAHVDDSATVTVEGDAMSDYTKYAIAGTTTGFVWSNSTPAGATISGDSSNTLYSSIQAAIDAAPESGTINLGSDFTVTGEVNVGKPLTINGNGHTLFAHINNSTNNNSNNAGLGIIEVALGDVTVNDLTVDGTGSTKIHDINIFDSDNIVLNNVTVKNASKAGITINGAHVTTNNVTTIANSWGGINIDLEDDATNSATELTVTGTSVHNETGPAIWRDDNTKEGVTFIDASSQYSSSVYTQNSVEGTTWGLKNATVNSEAELNAALADSHIETITFGSDIALTVQLEVNRSVTIDGGGYTLTTSATGGSVVNVTSSGVTIKNLIEDGGGSGAGNRGINIYVVTGVTLDTVTASNNAKNGIVVNGSTVTVNNITTSGNGWEGIDVDLGGGVIATSTLTVTGTSLHNETKAAIRIDDRTKPVSVVDVEGQYTFTDTGNARDYNLNVTRTETTSDQVYSSTGGDVSVTVTIPSGTIITGSTSWDGVMSAPTATSTTVTLSGFTTQVTSAISVGSPDSDLTFDKAVKLTFEGQAGQRVGFYNHAGVFTEISDTCSAGNDEASQTTALSDGAACKMDVSGDLVVWTKHFSIFVTYSATANSSGGSGGGSSSGGGGSISFSGGGTGTPNPLPGANVTVTSNTPSTPAQTGSQGEVLGAATYNFTSNLTIGSTGTDVTELQQILIAEGFDIPALTSGTAAYGYFGSQTRAAVSAYQRAHNISPSVGYVGPITRGQLNIGTVPTGGEPVTTGGHGMTAAQINAIIGLLQSFNADASVIANVRASLGV